MQFLVITFDLFIIFASAMAIYLGPKDPLTWFLVLFTFKTWHEQGGFFAWNKDNIKKFLSNAKKIGL